MGPGVFILTPASVGVISPDSDGTPVQTTSSGGVLGRLPGRYARAYLVTAFFLLPAVAVVLSRGGLERPPGPAATALLWGIVLHHSAFLIAAVLLD